MNNQITTLNMSDTSFLERIEYLNRVAKRERLNWPLIQHLLEQRLDLMRRLNNNTKRLLHVLERAK